MLTRRSVSQRPGIWSERNELRYGEQGGVAERNRFAARSDAALFVDPTEEPYPIDGGIVLKMNVSLIGVHPFGSSLNMVRFGS
jgi:hypothetical protein